MKIQRAAMVTNFEKLPDPVHSIKGHIVLSVEPGETLMVPLTFDEIETLFPKLSVPGTKRATITIEIE